MRQATYVNQILVFDGKDGLTYALSQGSRRGFCKQEILGLQGWIQVECCMRGKCVSHASLHACDWREV